MFNAIINARDQFTLANAHLYLSQPTIQPFVFFANHVPIRPQLTLNEEDGFEKLADHLNKALNTFGVKLIVPFRTLLLRMFQSNMGFVTLHLFFLKICRILSMPSEALPILEYPGLFKSIRRSQHLEFLLQACNIYIELRKYEQAYEVIHKAARLDSSKDELLLPIYKRLIVLSIFKGKPVTEFRQGINKLHSKMQLKLTEQRMGESLQKKPKFTFIDFQIYSFFLTLKEWKELKQDEAIVLQKERLLDVFNASRFCPLGRYIETDIKGLNWRVKAESVKDIGIGEMEVIKGVNQSKEIYKYDSQQKIMYFNHKACEQNQLNDLISKAFLMQNEVNNCKIETRDDISRGFGASIGLMSVLKKKSRTFKGHDNSDDE